MHVAKGEEKQMQRALLQWSMPQNWRLVRQALTKLGREDLIGYGHGCLVRPERTDRMQWPARTGGGGRTGNQKGRYRE